MGSKLKSLLIISTGGCVMFSSYGLYRGDEHIYESILMPFLRKLTTAEGSHSAAITAAKYSILPRINIHKSDLLKCCIFQKDLDSPVGLAAGFDKQGEAMEGLLKLGFGFVEIGSITPEPQPGNPKPRVFRLTEDKAVVNRYGFNSDGHGAVLQRLLQHNSKQLSHGVVGVNLGVNKTSTDPVKDYVEGVKVFGCAADYLVVNVSSPNTAGVRDMQGRAKLQTLLEKVDSARKGLPCKQKPAVLVKIAPDLTAEDKRDIASVLTSDKVGIDGLIATNTTIQRPDSLQSSHKEEKGGLSGRPLKEMSTQTIKEMYKLTKGKLPIIGVGGIESGQDAFDKIKAGASLVQLYTALAYQGPPLANKVNKELDQLLRENGFNNVQEAVGADVKDTS